MEIVHWILATDAGLVTRIAIGVTIFAALAASDYHRNGPAATCWREYGVLLFCVGAAVLYGVINDLITSTLSWEYFYYGKGLDRVLGPEVPPAPGALHWEAAKIGMKATWTVGLILGVALLLANNPRARRPRLAFQRLLRWIPAIFTTAALCAIAGGWIGYAGGLDHASKDFQDILRENLFRPHRFIAAWGVNLGGYIGGLAGTAIAVVGILRSRKNAEARLGNPAPSPSFDHDNDGSTRG